MSSPASLLRVAMFTPLPPARTGTADYAASLTDELRRILRLEVFTSVPRGFSARQYDAVVYQLANNPWHADFYRLAQEQPGIIALHDSNLHDLVRGLTLDAGNEQAYLREVMYEIFGQDTPTLKLQPEMRPENAYETPQPKTFTVLRRVLNASRACITHSGYADREVRLKTFTGPTAVIPHGAAARDLPTDQCRRSLGIAAEGRVIGLFGYQRPNKRAIACLRAFAHLVRSIPEAVLLIAGEPHPDVQLIPLMRELNIEHGVKVIGHLESLESFDECMGACDVLLNLRHPTFGETSGTMMRAFGLGRTVIVSDTGACRELPDDVCLRIPPDVHEETVLAKCLDWLFEDPSRPREIGKRAQDWVVDQCSWPRAAQKYRDFIESVAAIPARSPAMAAPAEIGMRPADPTALADCLDRWNTDRSQDYFASHRDRLIRTVQLIPQAFDEDSILEIGCYMQITPLLATPLGYSHVRGCRLGKAGLAQRVSVTSEDGEIFECTVDLFDAEKNIFPYPDLSFATVVCGEVLEHLESDPVRMMIEIHRVLKAEGILVLTTPNIVSLRAAACVLKGSHPASFHRYSRPQPGGERAPGHSREYTPDEIRLLLSDCGFIPLHIETGAYRGSGAEHSATERLLGQSGFPVELRGDCIYAVARKELLPRKRFPNWLYGE